ncbi:hypothetical protein Bca101_028649 [Brassica carinata]
MEVIHSWSCPRSLSTALMYSFAQRDDIEVLDEPLNASFLKATGADRLYRDEIFASMNLAKHRILGLPSELMSKGKHFILIRNPVHILPSFGKVIPLSFLDVGLADLVSIYSDLCQMGTPPPVIDADDLQRNPEVSFLWEAGPIPEDGVWASWWRHVKGKSSLLASPLAPPSLPVPENAKLFAWVGAPAGVPAPGFEPWPLRKFTCGLQHPRPKTVTRFPFLTPWCKAVAVWEGLRIYKGKVFKLEEHLERLFDSAKALAFNNVPTRDEVKAAIFKTLITNGMFDNTHIRLSLTRGKKVTSGMSPAFNRYGCTLIVLAEWKPPVYDNDNGIVLVTATTRRNSPTNLDSKIHHNNLLNNILAKVESNNANVDDAIMLDKDGFVSETNATNLFMVKNGVVLTPHADYCLPGITRATVMELVVKENFILEERNISLSEFHTADEVWTTGTIGELSPVVKIDGRVIGEGEVGPVTRKLQSAYKKLTDDSGVPIPTYQKL